MAERMSINRATYQIVVFGLSDRGLHRDNNEDHFMVADLTRKVIGVHDNQLHPELFHHDIGAGGTMLMVADGLGGHEGGEVASRLAVDIVAQALVNAAEPALPMSEQIVRAVDMAHVAICKHPGASGQTRHMASTLTVVHVGHGVLIIAQVGDSRAYRFNGGQLTLLTDDQTVVHMMQKKGKLTPEEAQNHPHRNIILQALGQDKSVLPEIQTLPFSHNDYLLLCSDGLSSYVAHERIEAILSSGEDEHVRCHRLVEAANAAGGADNVTVLLARLIIKENVRPEAVSKPLARSAPHGAEHVPTSIRVTEASVPRTVKTVPATPASEPAKLPLWKREIKWPWGHKTANSAAPRPPKPEPAETLTQEAGAEGHPSAKPGHATSTAPWDPRVLKAVEDSLAEHIGPVAKILVGRAAHHTKDLQELCQALAAQLSTEQERKSFLHNALPQKQTPSRCP
jgi:serine/threonine protein phosphatase PrpC